MVSIPESQPVLGNCKMNHCLNKYRFYVHWSMRSIFQFPPTLGLYPMYIHIIEENLLWKI